MDFDLQLRNRHVVRLVLGTPAGGEGIQARIQTNEGDVIALEGATLAALVRAYMAVTTHPTLQAIELRSAALEPAKAGFASHQLIEIAADEAALRAELAGHAAAAPASEDRAWADTAPSASALPAVPDAGGDDDLELDDPDDEGDDGPVFGETPTHHGKPTPKG
jgi:hypothetical protein